jgi:hypothetical protein
VHYCDTSAPFVPRIPVAGGTVDFDQRFGSRAKCGTFGAQEPNVR